MRQAFSTAENMEYAMNVEKKTAAQLETLLDYSYSGVIRLDGNGEITAVNPLMEDMVGKTEAELKGENIRKAAPMIGEEAWKRVFEKGEDYSLFFEWNGTPIFAVLAPVLYEARVDGAIITCHKMKKKTVTPERSRGGQNRENNRVLPPLVQFEDILQKSTAMQECIRKANLYALSEHPVVLIGEPGTEKRMLAESIHNSSIRAHGPFLDVPCEGLSGEEQKNMIFGNRGAVLQVQGGTLLLRDVEELTAANQYRLYQLIRFCVCHGADIASLRKVDVRVMVTIGCPLSELMARQKISPDLYYLLSGLELFVPPLRERREDLLEKIENTIHDCCEHYSRYHVLTKGAMEVMLDYPWKGNLFQIESFCERLILMAGKRSIDEVAVRRLLAELYPERILGNGQGTENCDAARPFAMNENGSDTLPDEAVTIRELLHKFSGSREKTAQAMGISKATLWRHMKKYGIEKDR